MASHTLARVNEFLKCEDGPTAVEHGVMLALIVAVCLAAVSALGSSASKTFSQVAATIGNTPSGPTGAGL